MRGLNLTYLTADLPWDGFPVWSPDGTRIAFGSKRDGNLETYVMNTDGSGLARLTDNPGDDGPIWSPDGSPIAFVSRRDGSRDIYVVNASGYSLMSVTDNPITQGRTAIPSGCCRRRCA